jgi:F-type H+-transporting ATPase subunit b
MRRALVPALLGALGSAAAAHAAGGEHGGGGLGELVWPVVNLAILIAALVYFARAPIRAFFASRQGRIREDLDSASRALSDAEARHAEWQRRLVELDGELSRIRAQARERAEAERRHILADANAAAERIRGDARAAVDQELARAREELRHEAARLAVEVAAEALRTQVTDADRARLVDEFIAGIESSPRGAATRAAGA